MEGEHLLHQERSTRSAMQRRRKKKKQFKFVSRPQRSTSTHHENDPFFISLAAISVTHTSTSLSLYLVVVVGQAKRSPLPSPPPAVHHSRTIRARRPESDLARVHFADHLLSKYDLDLSPVHVPQAFFSLHFLTLLFGSV